MGMEELLPAGKEGRIGKRSRSVSESSDNVPSSVGREKKHACPYEGCDKRFVRPARLEEHIRSHTNERPFVCAFQDCEKAFLRQSHLDHHVKQNHTNERKWVCDWDGCGKSFVSGTRLRAHVKSHETKFYCTDYPPCKEIFRKKHTLQKHIDQAHLNLKPYRCTAIDERTGAVCSAGYDKASKLRQHEANNHGVKRYWCTLCQLPIDGDGDIDMQSPGFGTYTDLQNHIKDVHPPTCEHCSSIFKTKHQLNQHLEVHHFTLEERATHFCPKEGCSKAFTKVGNLNVHIRTVHEKAKPWVCGEADLRASKGLEGWDGSNACSQSFGVKSSLEGHIRVHHYSNGKYVEQGHKRAKTARARRDQMNQDVSTAARLTNGFGDHGVRDLTCVVSTCGMRFERDFDLEVHCQNVHSMDESEIAEALAEQRALNGGRFWVRGATGWEDDEDDFEAIGHADAVQVGIGFDAEVEPFDFIADGGLSKHDAASALDPRLLKH